MWRDLKSVIPQEWLKKPPNETTLTFELINNTYIELKGSDKPDCYDDETEILTYDGWTKIKDLPEDLAVMTLNPNTNTAEWKVPHRYIHQDYEGEMYQIKSKKLDLLVTPEHRFLVDSGKGVRKFKTVTELSLSGDKIPASVDWEGEEHPHFDDNLVSLMGIYLADGCANRNLDNSAGYQIVIAKKYGKKGGVKGDARLKIEALLDDMGITYTKQADRVSFNDKRIWSLVAGLGRAWEKRIPPQMMNLPRHQLEILIDWMLLGDGTIRERESGSTQRVYYTTSKGLADDFQQLLMKTGRSGVIKEKQQTDSVMKDGRVIKSGRKLYEIYICNNKHNYFSDSKEKYVTKTHYKGGIHCVEVENNTVFVRRNGKACWSGNSLLGVGLNYVVLDEFQSMRPEVWKRSLRPTLATTGGGALFIGTPRGYDHFHDAYQLGQDPKLRTENKWMSWHFKTSDSPFVPQSEIDAAKEDLDPKMFAQEFEASFENMSGRVYHQFDRAKHLSDCRFDPTLPIWIGQDFNIDPMASCVMQPQKDGTVNVIDEIVLPNSNTEEVCAEIERRYWRYKKNIVIYPDAAGGQRQHARGETDLDMFRQKGFRVKVRKRNPAVADRVNSVNRKLQNAKGDVNLLINRKCKHTINAMEQVIYKEGSRQVDKSIGMEHILDALGYCIEYEFSIRKKELKGFSY